MISTRCLYFRGLEWRRRVRLSAGHPTRWISSYFTRQTLASISGRRILWFESHSSHS